MAARKNKVKHDEKTKDAIRASQLINFLTKAALAKERGETVDATRVAAAKAALPFLRPMLSAVEQTHIDPRDTMDAAQLAQRLAALLTEKPELHDQIKQIMQRTNSEKSLEINGSISPTLQ